MSLLNEYGMMKVCKEGVDGYAGVAAKVSSDMEANMHYDV